MAAIIQFMLTLDRRWIYLVLGVSLIVSLIVGKTLTPLVLPPTQQLFEAVNETPAGPDDGKIFLVGMTFSAGTMGENGNQARAILRHLMLAKKRFAIISIAEPQGAEYAKQIVTDIAKQYGYVYGQDWISFGYQINSLALYKGITKDLPRMIKTDGIENHPLSDIAHFPIMKGIRSANDLAMHIEITASSSAYNWVTLVQPATKPRLKIGYACTGIMATEAYPFLDSGQFVGLLPGLKGAADYELLVDNLEAQQYRAGEVKQRFNYAAPTALKLPDPARKLMYTQGVAHLVVIIFIILGNVGLLLSHYAKRLGAKENTND